MSRYRISFIQADTYVHNQLYRLILMCTIIYADRYLFAQSVIQTDTYVHSHLYSMVICINCIIVIANFDSYKECLSQKYNILHKSTD